MGQQADQYQQEAEDDKHNECEVNDEYRICQHAVQIRVHQSLLREFCVNRLCIALHGSADWAKNIPATD